MGTREVRADVVRNRLYVTLKGFADDEEARENARCVIAELAKLKPGFTVISDISEMKATTLEGTRALESVLDMYKRQGIARLVRVVGKNVTGKIQFERMTRDAGLQVNYVASLAEAERLLDEGGASAP